MKPELGIHLFRVVIDYSALIWLSFIILYSIVVNYPVNKSKCICITRNKIVLRRYFISLLLLVSFDLMIKFKSNKMMVCIFAIFLIHNMLRIILSVSIQLLFVLVVIFDLSNIFLVGSSSNFTNYGDNLYPNQAPHIQVNQPYLNPTYTYSDNSCVNHLIYSYKITFSTEYNIKICIGLLILFILIIYSVKSNMSESNQSLLSANSHIVNLHINSSRTIPAPELNSNGVVINGNNKLNNQNKLCSTQTAQTNSALKDANIIAAQNASALIEINIYQIRSNIDLHNTNVHIKSNTMNPKGNDLNSICAVIIGNNNKPNNQNKSKGKQSLNNTTIGLCYYAIRTIILILIQLLVFIVIYNLLYKSEIIGRKDQREIILVRSSKDILNSTNIFNI